MLPTLWNRWPGSPLMSFPAADQLTTEPISPIESFSLLAESLSDTNVCACQGKPRVCCSTRWLPNLSGLTQLHKFTVGEWRPCPSGSLLDKCCQGHSCTVRVAALVTSLFAHRSPFCALSLPGFALSCRELTLKAFSPTFPCQLASCGSANGRPWWEITGC